MGTCPVCDELVWEDEWDMIDDIIIHASCRRRYIKEKYGMNEKQFLRLCGTAELRKEITETIEELKRSTGFYMEKLLLLESKLNKIEGGHHKT
jgi:hypothetical protein